ncbi:MAG: M23 family metallopeptidase [Ruminiclostridium sp.]|nr:M23 family metallopeptidase [Ruminiclostridium sp.]
MPGGIHAFPGTGDTGSGRHLLYGTNILAAKGGTVVLSTYGSSFGNHVAISHPDGSRTLYAHMSARLVSVGDTVSQGQVIGRVGSTGNSTGNHLHFEVWTNGSSGSRMNPMDFFS